jgi:hypothetical protein
MAAKKKTAAKKTTSKKPAAKPAAHKAAAKPAAKPKAAPPKEYGPRPDKGSPVDMYVAKLPKAEKEICLALMALVREAVPGVHAEIKWGMPVFTHHGLLCYVRSAKAYTRFGFYDHAGVMPDPLGLLEGESESGRHVKIKSLAEMDKKRITEWVKIAARENSRTASS